MCIVGDGVRFHFHLLAGKHFIGRYYPDLRVG